MKEKKTKARGNSNNQRWEEPSDGCGEFANHPKVGVYRKDFKKFYMDLLANDVVNRVTKRSHKNSLGKIHDYLIDFLNLGEPDVVRYSDLDGYLPNRNEEDGDYGERWIYWKTLEQPPVIQNGPVGPVSTMFREKFWQGLLIKIKGNALIKCLLIPRGHLKSTIATQAYTLWQMIREPDSRSLIRSLTQDTAKTFMSDIKFSFEGNAEFRKYFGHMGCPDKGVAPWNTDQMQICSKLGWRSRGKEYTLASKGMESELTGMHCDRVILDDVVGETNISSSGLRAAARLKIERMQAIPDPGSPFIDIGTRWEEDDVHCMFLDPAKSELAEDSSFMVATVLDGDEGFPVSRHLSQLGYGKPIWPEVYSTKEVARRRRAIRDDRVWYSQYYNQFMGTGLRTFSKGWVTPYEGTPQKVAEAQKLNLFIYFDTASGKNEQVGKLDYTAGVVIGQTQDRSQIYVLDGFREKLPSAQMTDAIVSLARKWHRIASNYGGSFWAGVEETAYTTHLKTLIDERLRKDAASKYVTINGVSHKNVAKIDRIRAMATAYSDRRILWPHELWVKPQSENQEPYDLMVVLLDEFVSWPGAANEDLLDAHAGAMSQTNLTDFAPEARKDLAQEQDLSRYVNRGQADSFGHGHSRLIEEEDWSVSQ